MTVQTATTDSLTGSRTKYLNNTLNYYNLHMFDSMSDSLTEQFVLPCLGVK